MPMRRRRHRLRHGHRRRAHRRRGAGDRDDRVEVDAGAHHLAHGLDARPGVIHLERGDESQVALDDAEARLLPDRAEHRDAREALDGGAQLSLVARARHPVEDHARDADRGVEGRQPVQERGRAPRHAARVQDEDDRQLELPRHRGVAVRAFQVQPVVQAEVALDDRDVAAGRVPRPLRGDLRVALQVQVEVAARALRREAQPLRIDVVGALLERLDREAAPDQAGDEPGGHGRLARRAPGGRNEDPAHGAPGRATWPAPAPRSRPWPAPGWAARARPRAR